MRQVQLKPSLSDPVLDVMNVLNEIVTAYPKAISFAPGRPLTELFHVDDHFASLRRFVENGAAQGRSAGGDPWNCYGQYGPTNGIITEQLAIHLARDENIRVPPEAIMVTVGAQEAMAVLLLALFDPARDVLMVSDPTYVGIVGFARLNGIRVLPVPAGADGLTASAVEEAVGRVEPPFRVRALYDIPDCNNPLGTRMPVQERLRLIEVCRRLDILFIEDNPYGMFVYDGERYPTCKSLDRDATVIYIGSVAKTLFPSLRVGYLVADQQVDPSGACLARELSRVKSYTTVNTSALCQAIVGAALTDGGGSLCALVEPKRARYRVNRDRMLAALACAFGQDDRISWNRPSGGFFVTVTLPFDFGMTELRDCAAGYGVVVCPMQCFSLLGRGANQVRLSFSYVTPDQIDAGVKPFAEFVRARAN